MIFDKITFGTSNLHKLEEARKVFESTGIQIDHYPVDLLELQDSSLEKIAIYSLETLQIKEKKIFVEDTGLFIESLQGFPGPYAAHAFKTIGNDGILRLMLGIENRVAYFESCIAFRNFDNQIVSFTARCKGSISNSIQGEKWGFDPIFIPKHFDNPNNLTFSQLGDDLKSKISHRALVLEKLKNYLVNKNST